MYVYIEVKTTNGIRWQTGFFHPVTAEFYSDASFEYPEEAATRVHWLNGGSQYQE